MQTFSFDSLEELMEAMATLPQGPCVLVTSDTAQAQAPAPEAESESEVSDDFMPEMLGDE